MSKEPENSLQELARLLKPLKDIPFEDVIRALYKVEVQEFVPARGSGSGILTAIVSAMKDACRKVQANPIERSRPNEVGNDMEPFVIRALQDQGLDAARPKTVEGKGKATGYPDVRIETAGLPIYLEVKTFAAKSAPRHFGRSTFRLLTSPRYSRMDTIFWSASRLSATKTPSSRWPSKSLTFSASNAI